MITATWLNAFSVRKWTLCLHFFLLILIAGLCGQAWAVDLPDLVMMSVSAPATATTGSSFAVTTTVKNQGTGSAAGSTVAIYLSTDNVITTSDILISSRVIPGLAVGAESSGDTIVNLSSNFAPGTYYIGSVLATSL